MEEKKDLGSQGSPFKKFMCVTAAAVCLFLLGIMALVVYVDPFFITMHRLKIFHISWTIS